MRRYLNVSLSVLLVGLIIQQAAPTSVHAEGFSNRPLLLEEGGNLGFFDSASLTLQVMGKVYRIDPIVTQIIVITPQGREQTSAAQLKDLAARLERLRGAPVSFQSRPDGVLDLLVLDERRNLPAQLP